MIEDGKVEETQNCYADKYAKADLLDDAYETVGFSPDFGDKGKWLRLTALVIRDSLGAIIGAVETLKDILILMCLQREDKFSLTHKIGTGVL